ncbi:PepSY domain-containing protein [Pseudomonas sp. JDS28PS106]|uniref:PepSY domain-containing protein n=1 Tax=Pseudomonas sp. JDS28PS106 TaxID=2497235 RepID=UPI002FD71A5E
MKTFTTLLAGVVIAMTAHTAFAHDLDAAQGQALRDNGTIQSVEKLNAAALESHPGAKITDTELENEYGKYIYKVELQDEKGIEWDLELDAVTGQVYEDHQDN